MTESITPVELMLNAFTIEMVQSHDKKEAMRAALRVLAEMEPTEAMYEAARSKLISSKANASAQAYILAAANEGEEKRIR